MIRTSASSSPSSSAPGTPRNRSRSSSTDSSSADNDGAAGCYSLCLPRAHEEDKDIELNTVSVTGHGNDSTPKPMPRLQPTWRTKQRFDPASHLRLDATGLHPNHVAIANGRFSDNETVRLLNYATEFAASSPLVCPRGFDATKHARQQADGSWGPDIAGIQGDNQLTDPQSKIDVFRWARIYRPNTHTDPTFVKSSIQVAGCVVFCLTVIATLAAAPAYVASTMSDNGVNCDFQPLNATATESLLQSLRDEFPQLVNATLENMSDWYPTIRANLSEPLYRDRDGNLLEEVCRSAAQTLDPVLALMVVFSLVAMQMLLQG